MKTIFNYQNDNIKIFPGFYDSILWDSNRIYYENLDREEGSPKVDVVDFDGYMKTVGERVTKLISQLFEPKYCDRCEFKGINSPRYYNFETDKLNIVLNIDLDALKEWVLGNNESKSGFDKYLVENYSTRSGFISYASNNVDDYFAYDFEDNRENRADILIDYYLLTKIYGGFDVEELMHGCDMTHYEYGLDEISNDTLYEYLEEVTE